MVWPAPTVSSFLRKGLLPDNLPPFVSSKSIIDPVLGDIKNYDVTAKIKGQPSQFNSSKRGFQRRAFGLPHPVFVRDAAVFFVKHWPEIEAHFKKGKGSVSVPDFEGTQSRAVRFTPHSDLPKIRLTRLAKYKYCLVTDISRCFPSIYTHSLPWALHGKEQSKKDRNVSSAKIFGNRLDYIFRQAQDGQTTGIPVGPDHSRVAAEIVLKAVDHEFNDSDESDGFIRHVDDYWIGGHSQDECDRLLQKLRRQLSEYSLDINEQKTRIVRTSSIISESWPYDLEAQLETALMHENVAQYQSRIVSLLGNVIDLSSTANDDGIIKFFIRRLDNWQKWDSHWEILEPFLAHCAIQFLHSFDYVAQIIVWRIRTERQTNADLWNQVAHSTLSNATKSGRDAEALWALWLTKELKVIISGDIYLSLIDNNGPLVQAAGFHMAKKGLVNGKVNFDELWYHVEGVPISGKSWPLSLELNAAGIKKPKKIDIQGQTALTSIFKEKCSLFNWDAYPFAFLDADDELDENPQFAIGSFSSEYENESDVEPSGAESFEDLDTDVPF